MTYGDPTEFLLVRLKNGVTQGLKKNDWSYLNPMVVPNDNKLISTIEPEAWRQGTD